ncbi:hypothetical protein [Candidatus Halocynthiibacter alkanivorans]|uniref:hypothetical protein n=1 Tax=Candidatus Halocynthiibacter alkanivorans TaxID=2267619 RepID=UPI000DF3B87E|nr:hypothetical protein [Candidatus Halocynthiibacter alkanivorans]
MPEPLILSFADQTRADEIRVNVMAGSKSLGTAWFRSRTGRALGPNGNALFCLGLFPASEVGSRLIVKAAVDRNLLERAGQISGMFRSWWPGCRTVSVDAEVAEPTRSVAKGAAAVFFSGGVDSSFTLAQEHENLQGIITILGADIPLNDREANDRLDQTCRDVARDFGIEPVVIETNVREIFHRYAGWTEYHGSVLSAIGHMLSDRFCRVLISASGNEFARNVPWGSNPELDPLFGTEQLAVEHFGLEERVDKIARISTVNTLMRHLRVCNVSRSNCGVCDKCTFVMAALSLLSMSDKSQTLPVFQPSVGSFHILDDAILSEFVRFRDKADSEGRSDLLPQLDAEISRYHRTRKFKSLLGLSNLDARFRVMKHRMRYRGIKI